MKELVAEDLIKADQRRTLASEALSQVFGLASNVDFASVREGLAISIGHMRCLAGVLVFVLVYSVRQFQVFCGQTRGIATRQWQELSSMR